MHEALKVQQQTKARKRWLNKTPATNSKKDFLHIYHHAVDANVPPSFISPLRLPCQTFPASNKQNPLQLPSCQ